MTREPTFSTATYAATFAALLGFTLLTSLLGLVDMGRFSIIIAAAIAAAKASLIVVFFMHALRGTRIVRVVIVGAVVMFLILFTTLGDYITRGWLPFPGK